MNSFGKIVLLGGGIFGVLFLYLSSVVKKMTMAFSGVTLEAINLNGVRLGFLIEVTNPGDYHFDLNRIDLNAFVNNRFLGRIENPRVQRIAGNRTSTILLTLAFNYSDLGKEIANLFKTGSTTQFDISISGSVYAMGLPIPVPEIAVYSVTFDELVKWTQTG